jgi:cytochrome c oxidase subunit 1
MAEHAAHAAHAAHHGEHHQLGFLRTYVFSTDHKTIGIQFLFSGLIFMILGGLLAVMIRIQLAFPDYSFPLFGQYLFPSNAGQMTPQFYTMIVSMHASVMIFFVIIPLLTGAFGNFLIPLQIGYKDMAFPVMNMFSYWFMPPAFVFIILSFFMEGGAAAAGWTSYPTLSVVRSAAPGSGFGQTFWYLALLCIGVSSLLGSINYMTTIINCRAPGMKMFRLPMTTWALFITATLQAFALPVLTVALLFGLLDNLEITGFFVPANLEANEIIQSYPKMLENFFNAIGMHRFAERMANTGRPTGGQPLMWQHLFWFYSHPAVYIMILPAMGMVSDIIATNARKPLFGYVPMVLSIAGIAGLGFIVWGHHMFMSGMSPVLGSIFMVSTMMIALPSAIKVFNWIFTLLGGNIRFTAAMLNAMAFVSLFIIGGLSGIYMASTPTDIHFHDTYFIVAHIHYVLFGGSLFGIFGAIYHWFPKMFGRMMNEFWGKVHFALTFILFNTAFYAMHNIGIMRAPRRYADLRAWIEAQDYNETLMFFNQLISHSVFLLAVVQLIFAVNFFYSLFWGPKASRNPWQSNSLEWETASPPPHNNFDHVPVVYRGPYEYSHPQVAEDWLPQTRQLDQPITEGHH